MKSKNTTPELAVRRLVHPMGYRYRLHVSRLQGTPDLIFPRLRKIIDVRGCFWHMHSCSRCRIPSSRRGYWIAKMRRNAARVKRTYRRLRRAGWRQMVIWECQIHSLNLARLRQRITAFLTSSMTNPPGTKRGKNKSDGPRRFGINLANKKPNLLLSTSQLTPDPWFLNPPLALQLTADALFALS